MLAMRAVACPVATFVVAAWRVPPRERSFPVYWRGIGDVALRECHPATFSLLRWHPRAVDTQDAYTEQSHRAYAWWEAREA